MNSGKFVSVELGSTQKSPARTPTKTYFPLETPAVPAEESPRSAATASNNPPETNQVTDKTPREVVQSNEVDGSTNADGITQEVLNVYETSLSTGVLAIQETTFEERRDTAGNTEGDVNPLFPDLSSMAVNDTFNQDISAAANALNSCATTSSPFFSFLRRDSNVEENVGNPQVAEAKFSTEAPMLGTPIGSPVASRGARLRWKKKRPKWSLPGGRYKR